MARSRRTTRPLSGLRELIRALVVVLGWVGFVWLWVLVAQRPWESVRLVWLIGGSIFVLPLITLAWVSHNRAIYRRKGERKGVMQIVPAYAEDWHGRVVEADWDALRRSAFVTISVNGGCKRYRGRAFTVPDRGPSQSPAHDAQQSALSIASAPATSAPGAPAEPHGQAS